MVVKASGLDKLAESFVDDDKATTEETKATRKPRRKAKTTEADERDPAVVAAQQGPCGSCGATDHGFNDCPNTQSLAETGAVAGTNELSTPNGNTLAARVFFSEDGWLTLPKDLPFEGYKELVTRFGGLHKNMLWMAGDLQAQGEAIYGQEYSQVLDMLGGHGYTESTLGIAKSMSEKFPSKERHADLSWNHHVIVMTLSKKERKYWLARAAAENLSTRELKAQIAVALGKPSTPATKTAPARREVVKEALEQPGVTDEMHVAEDEAPEMPVEVKNGVSLEMLQRADVADKAWYDALDQAIVDLEQTGSFDYEALRGPTRALAAELIDLIKALGDPRAK